LFAFTGCIGAMVAFFDATNAWTPFLKWERARILIEREMF
jgi:hypothetical protein